MSKSEAKTTLMDDMGVAHKYETTQFGALEATQLLPIIIRLAGVPFAHSLGVVPTLNFRSLVMEDHALGGDKLAKAIEYMCSEVETGGPDLMLRLLRYTHRTKGDGFVCVGEEAIYDTVFQGNLGEMFRAVAWVLEVNFGPLVKGALAPVKRGLQRVWKDAQNESLKNQTSTGSGQDSQPDCQD